MAAHTESAAALDAALRDTRADFVAMYDATVEQYVQCRLASMGSAWALVERSGGHISHVPGIIRATRADFTADVDLAVKRTCPEQYEEFKRYPDSMDAEFKLRMGREFIRRGLYSPRRYFARKDCR
jgi:hypothetical protein